MKSGFNFQFYKLKVPKFLPFAEIFNRKTRKEFVRKSLQVKMMSLAVYNDIMEVIESSSASKLRQLEPLLEKKYPTLNPQTLVSILNNFIQKKMKLTHGRHKRPDKIKMYYERYVKAEKNKEPKGKIIRLADEVEVTPVLMARIILEGYLRDSYGMKLERVLKNGKNLKNMDPKLGKSLTPQMIKSEIRRLLRNTNTAIPYSALAVEIYLCTLHDPYYGPLPDTIKNTIGKEYEEVLYEKLNSLGICYITEDHMRKSGYDRTPDCKLEVPIAIDGHTINWIESKALFGDEETHDTYLKKQLVPYINRFGPGLVIYWLGYVATLEERTTRRGIYIRDSIPEPVVMMNPSKFAEYLSQAEASAVKAAEEEVPLEDTDSDSD